MMSADAATKEIKKKMNEGNSILLMSCVECAKLFGTT